MKILITGFQPFGGQRVNPAWEAVRKLPDVLGDKVLWKLEIPVTFGGAFDAVEAKAAEVDPDVILCVGQAGGRDAVTPERIAVNLQDASIPDNAGNQPVDLPVIADGANAYFTSLPVKAMAAAVRAQDIPCRLSCTAGTYVCNCLLYTLLHTAAVEYPGMPGGFIHVPYALEQLPGKPEGTPGLALQQITRGLSCAIEAIAEAWT